MENQKFPLVSVVIPTYNRIHILPVSVNSVLRQTYENLELIIIDDGSDDGTEEYISGISDKRVRYGRTDKNMGVSAARNMGAKLAEGEYLAFQDSDDEWLPDKLEKQMKLMLSDSDLSMVYCEYGKYRDDELLNIVPSREIPYEEKQGDLFPYLLQSNLIGTPTILVKTRAFMEEGGFNETLKAYEDFEFSLRFAQKHRIGFVPEPLVKVNSLSNGVSKRYKESIYTQFYMVREMLGPLREKNLLENKLKIIFYESESKLCHDIFIEELKRLSEEHFSENEKQAAAMLLAKMEQNKEQVYLKMELLGMLSELKQKVLQIYVALYEKRIQWTAELQETLKELVCRKALFEGVFSIPADVQNRYASIQKKLEEEQQADADRLYLLAGIVELFETMEKLW